MGVHVSNMEGTLAGYDIVLAVSEEAVNAQLDKLYKTPITRGPLPPPTELPNYAPAPQAKYLINHDMSLHEMKKSKKTGLMEKSKEGIDAHIECPRIRFRPRGKVHSTMQYRAAFVEITFKRDDDAPEDSKDSVLASWDTSQSPPELTHTIVNGYTMSWQVLVAQERIHDVMNGIDEVPELIKSSDNKTIIPEKAAKEILAANSEIFTVSSVFCVFQEQTIVDSFQLQAPNGKETGLDEADIVKQFKISISNYFTLLQKEQKVNGAATVDNPFILGYSLSQKLPDLKAFDPSASTAQTPLYFQPKQWGLTVTPGKAGGNGPIATSGTLNYCLFTHREGNNNVIDVDQTDQNAGIFTETFFDRTKTFGRTKDGNDHIQGHDGIMAFSREIFSDRWLADVARALLLDPSSTYRGMLASAMKEPEKAVAFAVKSPSSVSTTAQGCEIYQRWNIADVEKFDYDLMKPYDRRKRANGECRVKIQYRSDNPNIRSLQHGIDHSRKVYLDITVENTISYSADTKGLHNLLQNEFSATQWLNARTMDCRMRSLVAVEIVPSSAGKWAISVNRDASKNLFKPNEQLQWQNMDGADRYTYGNFDKFETHHTYKWFGQPDANEGFRKSIRGWGTSTLPTIENGLKVAFKDMGTKVIMPAGEVSMFAGLDSDSDGNIYAQVSYANDGGVKIVQT